MYHVYGSLTFNGAHDDLPAIKRKGRVLEYFQDFDLSDEAYEMLKNQKITEIRAVSIINKFDLTIEEQDRNEVKALFSCICIPIKEDLERIRLR